MACATLGTFFADNESIYKHNVMDIKDINMKNKLTIKSQLSIAVEFMVRAVGMASVIFSTIHAHLPHIASRISNTYCIQYHRGTCTQLFEDRYDIIMQAFIRISSTTIFEIQHC